MGVNLNPGTNPLNLQGQQQSLKQVTQLDLKNLKYEHTDKVVQQFAKGELNKESSRTVFQKIMVALEAKAPGVADLVNKLFGVLGDASTKQRELLHANLVNVLEYEVQRRGEKAGHDLTDTQITMINFFCEKSGGLSKNQRQKLSYHKSLLLGKNPSMKGRFSQHSATRDNIAKLKDVLVGKPENELKNNTLAISDNINHVSVNSQKRLHNLEISHGVGRIDIAPSGKQQNRLEIDTHVSRLSVESDRKRPNLSTSEFSNLSSSQSSSRIDQGDFQDVRTSIIELPENKQDDQSDFQYERQAIRVFHEHNQHDQRDFQYERMLTGVNPEQKQEKYELSFTSESNIDSREFQLEKKIHERLARVKDLESSEYKLMRSRVSYSPPVNSPVLTSVNVEKNFPELLEYNFEQISNEPNEILNLSNNILENMLKNDDQFDFLFAYVLDMLQQCKALEDETIILEGIMELTYSEDPTISNNATRLVTALLDGNHVRQNYEEQPVEIKQPVDLYNVDNLQEYKARLNQFSWNDFLSDEINSPRNDSIDKRTETRARNWIQEVRFGLQRADWPSAHNLIEVLIRHAYLDVPDLSGDDRKAYGLQAKNLLEELVNFSLDDVNDYKTLHSALQEVSYNILMSTVVEFELSGRNRSNVNEEDNRLRGLEFVAQNAFLSLDGKDVIGFVESYQDVLTFKEIDFILNSYKKW